MISTASGRRILRAARAPGWGLLDQGVYSGTNFVAVIVVARVLGPESFGAFAFVLAVWATIWVLTRAVFAEPFVIRASALPLEEWRYEASLALGTILATGVAMAAGLALVALLLPAGGQVTRTLLVLAPFVPLLLLQDFWRVAAFSRERGGLAVMNDAAWGVVQFAAFGALLAFDALTAPAALAAWALGSLAGCLVGFSQFRLRPALGRATAHWAARALGLGGWFGAGRAIQAAGMQSIFVVVGLIAGLAAVGGLRSVYTLFGPLGIALRSAEMTALPSMARAEGSGRSTLVRGYFAVLTALGLGYGAMLVLGGGALLGGVFGAAFVSYSNLLIPIALAHAASAAGLAAYAAVRVMGRAQGLFCVDLTAAMARLVFVVPATVLAGVGGAAWGMAFGAVLGNAGFWWLYTKSKASRDVARLQTAALLRTGT
jgi:O-antigen/teichoic acid export membrane protein